MTSQNGYSINPPLNKKPFPGTKIVPVPGIRRGDVATVLHYVGSQFNEKVEKLVNPGCWGYANRPIRGSKVISNHASGTAIDLNAPKHPLGARGTFSWQQKSQINKIIKYCEGTVRWGGDYTSRADEMHFEIVAPLSKVKKIADKIKNGKLEDMVYRGKTAKQHYQEAKIWKAKTMANRKLLNKAKSDLLKCKSAKPDAKVKDNLFKKIKGIFGK